MENMYKKISIGLAFALLGSTAVIYSKSSALDAAGQQLSEISRKLESTREEGKKLKIASLLLRASSDGLYPVKPETLKEVRRVADFIFSMEIGKETKFNECWDRQSKTKNWGNGGPDGLLEHCIDLIEDSKSAILLKEINDAVDLARNECSEGENRFEAAKSCWADSNFRLLSGASNTLFDALTTPNWLSEKADALSASTK